MKFGPWGYRHPHATLLAINAQIRRPGPGENCHFNRTRTGVQAQTLAAVEGDVAHVATGEFIANNQLASGVRQLIASKGNFNSINFCRSVKTRQMSFEPKQRGTVVSLVAAHTFKDAAAVMEPVHRDMHVGFLPRN